MNPVTTQRQVQPSGYGGPMTAPPLASAPPLGAPNAMGTYPAGAYPQKSFAPQQQYGAPPPYGAQQPPQYAQQQPQYAQQQPTYGAPPQQQYGATQPYGVPPLAQPPQMGSFPQQPGFNSTYQPQPAYQQAGGFAGAPMGAPAMSGYTGGPVSLAKGGNMSLTKAVPNLSHVKVGLGWDVRQTPGAPFDLDASVFLLKADGKVRMPQDLIFYNNRQSIDGSVYHHGDNLTGQGEGDDESISVDLTRVPPDIQKIVCVVSIYEAEVRGQNFGMVSRAFIRVLNADNTQEIVRFDLTEEASLFSAMVFGELYRYNGEWKFRAIGQGVPGGLKACGPMFGIAMM